VTRLIWPTPYAQTFRHNAVIVQMDRRTDIQTDRQTEIPYHNQTRDKESVSAALWNPQTTCSMLKNKYVKTHLHRINSFCKNVLFSPTFTEDDHLHASWSDYWICLAVILGLNIGLNFCMNWRSKFGLHLKVKVKCAILLLEFRRGAHLPS